MFVSLGVITISDETDRKTIGLYMKNRLRSETGFREERTVLLVYTPNVCFFYSDFVSNSM